MKISTHYEDPFPKRVKIITGPDNSTIEIIAREDIKVHGNTHTDYPPFHPRPDRPFTCRLVNINPVDLSPKNTTAEVGMFKKNKKEEMQYSSTEVPSKGPSGK